MSSLELGQPLRHSSHRSADPLIRVEAGTWLEMTPAWLPLFSYPVSGSTSSVNRLHPPHHLGLLLGKRAVSQNGLHRFLPSPPTLPFFTLSSRFLVPCPEPGLGLVTCSPGGGPQSDVLRRLRLGRKKPSSCHLGLSLPLETQASCCENPRSGPCRCPGQHPQLSSQPRE